MKSPQTHPEQFNKAYEFIANVTIKQQRFISEREMYAAYPFKKELSKHEFNVLYNTIKETINI